MNTYKIKVIRDDKILYINTSYEKIFGYILDENIENLRNFYKHNIHDVLFYVIRRNNFFNSLETELNVTNTKVYIINDNEETEITSDVFKLYNYVAESIKMSLIDRFIREQAHIFNYIIIDDNLENYIDELSDKKLRYKNVLFFDKEDDLINVKLYANKKPCSTLKKYLD